MIRIAGFSLSLLFLLAVAVIAQEPENGRQASVTGTVVDATTQSPIVGATVQVMETERGVIADANGQFTIYNLPPGNYQLRFSSVGYEPVIRTDVVVYGARPQEVFVGLNPTSALTEEVVVRPDYFQKNPTAVTSVQTLSNEEIRRLPGGFEDVVRAISTLPGVAQVSGGRNDLLVRGGAPSENLYLIDNIESPNINHFGTQGAGGGPLSFVNLDFVREVTFSTGGFGAKYGDRISSVLNIDLREGRKDRTGGKATISASQFGLNLEGPVTEEGSYIFSARRSYLDLIFKAAGFSFVPEYWDFLGKATYRLGPSDQLSGLAIAAIDRVRFFNDDQDDIFDNSRILDNSQDQLVAGITWKHLFENGYVNTTFGRTRVAYEFRQTDSSLQPIFENSSTEDEFSLRVDAVVKMGERMELGFGGQAKTTNFEADIFLDQPGFQLDLAPEDRFYKGAVYAQVSRQVWEGLRANVGGRLDYFSGIEKTVYPSIRASFTQAIGDLTAFNLSAGRYFQAPSYIWLVANEENRDLKSIQTDMLVGGIERTLAEDVKVSLEGYYKKYDDYPASLQRQYLVLANTGAGFGGADEGFASFGLEPLASLGEGRSYGAEVLVQKKLSETRYFGTAALSLNWSYFTPIDGVERPSNFDQRIIFNLSGGYQITEEWEVGVKFRFATGRPYTPVDSTGDPGFGFLVVDEYNTLRLDPSHSLDVRVDKRWPIESWNLITYIDVQNIYNRQNPQVPRYNARLGTGEVEDSIGILPSIGISAEF